MGKFNCPKCGGMLTGNGNCNKCRRAEEIRAELAKKKTT